MPVCPVGPRIPVFPLEPVDPLEPVGPVDPVGPVLPVGPMVDDILLLVIYRQSFIIMEFVCIFTSKYVYWKYKYFYSKTFRTTTVSCGGSKMFSRFVV